MARTRGGLRIFSRLYAPLDEVLYAGKKVTGTVTNTAKGVTGNAANFTKKVTGRAFNGVSRIGRAVTGSANSAIRRLVSRKNRKGGSRKASRKSSRKSHRKESRRNRH